jgi:hypothetical protein
MLEERAEPTEVTSEEPYEPPAVVTVGSAAEMTAGDFDSSPTFDSPESDRRLKQDVSALEGPLERLRAIRTH